MRGSNPDAALYWFCRMIDGGADPKYLSRRLVRMAVEDIGLADPRATDLAVNGADIYERLGSPEGELALAGGGLHGLRRQVERRLQRLQPGPQVRGRARQRAGAHPPAQCADQADEQLGHGKAYRYATSRMAAAAEQYFPDGLNPSFYRPTDRGLEAKIQQKLAFLRELDAQERAKKR